MMEDKLKTLKELSVSVVQCKQVCILAGEGWGLEGGRGLDREGRVHMVTTQWLYNADRSVSYYIVVVATSYLLGIQSTPCTHIHNCTHSCPHSCPHTLMPSHTHALTHSCPHTLMPSHTHALTHSCPHTLMPSHTHALTHSCPHSASM